jgi:nucleoside-diphosphate-sugar epimerase
MMDLVTGATGFLGPHLTEALVKRGRRVRCAVRDPARADALRAIGAEVRAVDLLDRAALLDAMTGVERVFHLAGGGKVSATTEAGLVALRTANVAPLRAVVEVARERGVQRVLHFSSISAMGIQAGVLLDESSPCRPSTPHEIAKLESEQVAREAWEGSRLPIVVLRPAQIYGPGDVRSEIPTLVRLARRGLVPLFGMGRGRLPWVYVSDVVDAALAAAERPEAIGRTYIVSDAEPYRFADIVRAIARGLGRRRGGFPVPDVIARPAIGAVERIARRVGRDPPFTLHRLASISGDRRLSIERARRELGYAPRVGLDQGMQESVRWYAARGIA